ncbi:MAG TPA: PAS domain-containing sensor histidine kinase [Azospirillaceae bacterium]|nr:PAS domain-containing sensor histidine kinase [Azospirillaceae bacterium]
MTTQTAEQPIGMWRHFMRWAVRARLGNKLALLLTVCALGAGVATYRALSELPPFGNDPDTLTLLLTLDLALVLLLGAFVARRIVSLWIERRRGLAGSRLHVRLVALFSLLAVVPTIMVAVFSGVFIYVGLQSWFSDRVRTAITESLAVAQAYLHEHQQTIRADVLAMANDLNRAAPRLIAEPGLLREVVMTQAAVRGLTEAVVFDGTERILARAGLTFLLDFDPVPDDALVRARTGEVVIMTNESDDRVRALIRLDRYVDTFLFVGRLVEPRVLAHMERVQGAAQQYEELNAIRSNVQVTFTAIFIGVSLLLLLASVWVGLIIANQIVTPISHLIGAAERVRAGDLSARVNENTPADEIGTLSRAFNRMTDQLEEQRADLMEANRQLDLRRRFTEAVLSGVSAGVLGLDQDGRINLPNKSAADLLGVEDPSVLVGQFLTDVAPAMEEPLQAARRRPGRLAETQVQLRHPGETPKTLLVRIAAEVVGGDIRGYVVTFDDVSELLSAQRKAAWADVARRIAHEIKNPLTPIQLSAERLKRKYLKQISNDPETFQTCTDTIIRQVDDIGRMVDEFSAFARMPNPTMKPQNLGDIVRQAIFLQANAHPGITISKTLPDEPIPVVCDGRQLMQALTNLLKNAAEAIEGRTGTDLPPGRIDVSLDFGPDAAAITVADNGKGLPVEDRDRLTEPYVTTRAKGTGLGLAIVKKIMEDHGGDLRLADREGGGALVSLIIPRNIQVSAAEPAVQQQVSHGA